MSIADPAALSATVREHLAQAINFLPANVDVSASAYHLGKLREALEALVVEERRLREQALAGAAANRHAVLAPGSVVPAIEDPAPVPALNSWDF